MLSLVVDVAESLRSLVNQPSKCFWILACFSALLLSVPIGVFEAVGELVFD